MLGSFCVYHVFTGRTRFSVQICVLKLMQSVMSELKICFSWRGCHFTKAPIGYALKDRLLPDQDTDVKSSRALNHGACIIYRDKELVNVRS